MEDKEGDNSNTEKPASYPKIKGYDPDPVEVQKCMLALHRYRENKKKEMALEP